MHKLAQARVAVFGLGGVGGYTVEALARCGIGAIDLIDDDTICLTNINRQILATHQTIGQYKVDVAEARIHDLSPQTIVRKHRVFYLPETAQLFDLSQYDYIVDAIDTVSGKIELIRQAQKTGTPIISAMGAGNKADPTAFVVADIYETSVCPLAKVMRKLCRDNQITTLKVVYSREPALTPAADLIDTCATGCICPPDTTRTCSSRRQVPGSNSFVPPVAGLILAGEVIKDLIRSPLARPDPN